VDQSLGAEPRYISLNERDGQMQVVLLYFTARKVTAITVGSARTIGRAFAEAKMRDRNGFDE